MIPYPLLLSRIPFDHLEGLDDSIVSFAYPRPREVPAHWEVLLDETPDLDRVEPEVSDREAVATLLDGLRHALIESFESGRGSALFTTAGIDDPAQWRNVLLDCYCRPQRVYTNAQRTFVVVQLPQSRFRVAELPSLESLHQFRTLGVRTLPDPHAVVDFGHEDAAETYVLGELSTLELRAVPLRRMGERRRTVLWQAAGSRPGPRGQEIHVYLARLGGTASLVEAEAERCDPYTVLNQLPRWLPDLKKDEVPEVCATCAGFRFSGIVRENSGGLRGYCRRRLEAARASGLPMSNLETRPRHGTVVSVFDRCSSWEHIRDQDREVEFCQHGPKPSEED